MMTVTTTLAVIIVAWLMAQQPTTDRMLIGERRCGWYQMRRQRCQEASQKLPTRAIRIAGAGSCSASHGFTPFAVIVVAVIVAAAVTVCTGEYERPKHEKHAVSP